MSPSPLPTDLPAGSVADARAASRTRAADYLTLTKPRLNFLVLLTTAAAYRLGVADGASPWNFVHTMVGTALVAGGASALNQVWERDSDRLMRRTRMRPLPDSRMSPDRARAFGLILSAIGLGELAVFVNPLTSLMAFLTLLS